MTTKSALALHYAHVLYRNRPDFAWSDIVRHAWYFVRFRQWLSEGLVSFTYLKKDNSIRDARGTLCDLLIPREDMPKDQRQTTNDKRPNYAIVNYYDIDKKAWRSFDIRLFIGYVELYPLQKETEKRTKKE